jgi:hypothetical protein
MALGYSFFLIGLIKPPSAMKAASIIELKEELSALPSKTLLEICLRLARYKKDNKELLTYILLEAHNEAGFVESVKKEIDEQFEGLPASHFYFLKKGLRRILRSISRHCRHSGIKESALEILIHFCTRFNEAGFGEVKDKAIANIYARQLEKLKVLVKKVHEDLQFDFTKRINALVKP